MKMATAKYHNSVAVTPKSIKYPPKSAKQNNKRETNELITSREFGNICDKSYQLEKPRLTMGKATHRRNVSSQFQPYPKTVESGRHLNNSEFDVSSQYQFQRSPLTSLVDDEASNFNVDDINEANSRRMTVEPVYSQKSKKSSSKYTGGMYAAKYSYKSFLENQDMGKQYSFIHK